LTINFLLETHQLLKPHTALDWHTACNCIITCYEEAYSTEEKMKVSVALKSCSMEGTYRKIWEGTSNSFLL
jgi:hypothetical protein